MSSGVCLDYIIRWEGLAVPDVVEAVVSSSKRHYTPMCTFCVFVSLVCVCAFGVKRVLLHIAKRILFY